MRCDQNGDVRVSLASGSCAAARTKRRTFFNDDGGSERARSEAGRGSPGVVTPTARPRETRVLFSWGWGGSVRSVAVGEPEEVGGKTAACGAHNGSRSQLVEGPGGRRTTAAMRAQHFASASTLAATSTAQSFATAAAAPSAGIVMLACRDVCRLIVVTAATSGQAARVPRLSQATDTDPHLGRGVQHRRRRRSRSRRRRLTAPKVAACKGCP